MVEAAEKNKVNLLCGHTASMMAAYQAMRDVVRSGELGKVCAINVWSYSDWMFRPRMPQEVDLATGGGVPYRQGPHQVDTVRMIGGGRVRSVRATTGQWFPGRKVPGYYSAFIDFEEGHAATIVHNGYGHFSTFELVPWAGRSRYGSGPAALRKQLRAAGAELTDETRAKNERRFGGRNEAPPELAPGEQRAQGFQPDLGIVVVSCELGDIRQSPTGLWVYDDEGQHDRPVAGIDDERMGELDEMYHAVEDGRPLHHDGRWGMATLEVVLAIMQSAKERREIMMQHQVAEY
jgi:phthalate 4,5-cis-dihydrodiol dehydrogenase